MTSITSTQTHPPMTSPRERLQKELESEISSGTVQAADGTALSSALDAIDQAMRASRSASASSQSAPPEPEEMKAKIDGLIDAQVEDGSLTTEQADALKQLFANAAPQGGPGGPGGAGGPPPPPEDEEDTTSATSDTAVKTDIAALLEEFLKQLQEKKSETTGYGTTGNTTSTDVTALVLDTAA